MGLHNIESKKVLVFFCRPECRVRDFFTSNYNLCGIEYVPNFFNIIFTYKGCFYPVQIKVNFATIELVKISDLTLCKSAKIKEITQNHSKTTIEFAEFCLAKPRNQYFTCDRTKKECSYETIGSLSYYEM